MQPLISQIINKHCKTLFLNEKPYRNRGRTGLLRLLDEHNILKPQKQCSENSYCKPQCLYVS